MKKKLIPWLGASLIVVIIFGTIYATVQQSERRAANDPQIQLAEDTTAALDKGRSPHKLTAGHRVDIGHSLAPFVVIYSRDGKPLAGSGYLDGHLPDVPFGVLSAARGKDYNFVTWQPTDKLRIAAVSTAGHDYYVLSGRSLKEVEKNENQTMELSLLGAVAALLVLAVAGAAVTKR